jgi:hypothetical protein
LAHRLPGRAHQRHRVIVTGLIGRKATRHRGYGIGSA